MKTAPIRTRCAPGHTRLAQDNPKAQFWSCGLRRAWDEHVRQPGPKIPADEFARRYASGERPPTA